MIELSDSQKRTVASGVTMLAVAVVAGFAICIGWFAIRVLAFLSPAIAPLVVGLFLALFFKPYYSWWLKIVKNPSLAMLLMFASIAVPLGFALWHFGTFAAAQIGGLVEAAPQRAARFLDWFNANFPNARAIADKLGIPYAGWIEGFKDEIAEFAAGSAKYLSSLVNWLVSLVFFAYFLTRPSMTGNDYVAQMPFLKDDTKLFVASQIDAFTDIIVSFFQRQVVICLVEGVLYGCGFALVGLKSGFFIGFALGVLNLVPLFGTVVCLPVALILSYFGADGSVARLAAVLAVWLAGQVLDGYVITPKIQGEKTGLGYAGVVFSFFFWGVVFKSFLGLLLAIPLSAFCVVFWRAIKSRYIRPVV